MGLGLCAESKAPKMCFSLAPKSKYKNITFILNYLPQEVFTLFLSKAGFKLGIF